MFNIFILLSEFCMIKKINDYLAGLPMTIVGGVFLLASFILPRTGHPEGEYLAWVCVIVCGIPLLYLSVWRIIYNKGISKISSALLITVAMIAAILIGDLFAAGEVAFIMEIGAILEDLTTERAKKGLKNLLSLSPKTGRILRDGKEIVIPAEEIKKGDILRILPGETIPVDGIILEGETSVDQSVMTGESLPVDKTVGDPVAAGTLNCYGSIDIEASKVGEDSSLAQLIRLVQDAEKSQAPTQRIADRWASFLVPVALGIAIAAYLITKDITRAVTVMVVFCPCALVLATPTAIIAAIGQATRQGVIIRSGEALEKMGHIRTIAFDKTGTLTEGHPSVSDVIPLRIPEGYARTDAYHADPKAELLRLAASAESRSEHPLGRAIVEKFSETGQTYYETDSFRMDSGKGICAVFEGEEYRFGNERFLQEHGVPDMKTAAGEPARLRKEGKAVVLAADRSGVFGIIGLSDRPRPDAADMIGRLRRMGTKCVLLTGDHKEAAAFFASQAGISEIRAELLPEEKVSGIRALQESGPVCMIGDGVNDAPALKTADVGVAMGAMGSDIAVEAADFALMTDDLSKIPYLKWLSETTVKTIRGAIALSMALNFIAIVLSVTGVLTPTLGALWHNAGSCFVVLLAALLYDRKYPAKD